MDEVKKRRERVIKADVINMKNRLNARQRALVIYLLEQPEADLQALQGVSPNVPRRTLQRDLQQAAAKGVRYDDIGQISRLIIA
jgi:hypothetical protein